jgi:flagella basal body P-ring formation protein FlgA
MIRKLILCLAALSFAAPARAGGTVWMSFYDSALVNDSVIRLRDLAVTTDVEGKAPAGLMSTVVGEAAPPGCARYVNTGEIFEYRLAGVLDRTRIKYGSPKRIRVKTDCAVHRVSDFENKILGYVRGTMRWNPDDVRISIENPDRTCKILRKPCTVRVEGMRQEYPVGTITVKLMLEQGSERTTMPVSCKLSVTTEVLVASKPIARGAPLGSANCAVRRKEMINSRFSPFTSIGSVSGYRARRTIMPGTMIHDRHIERIPLVARGDRVSLSIGKGRVRASIEAVAREAGVKGDRIWVENPRSHKLLRARVRGGGKVTLDSRRGGDEAIQAEVRVD